MPRVVVSHQARDDLERMVRVLSLPNDTRGRVRASMAQLGEFPHLGVVLGGDWEGFPVVLGPWRWMLIVYAVLADGTVAVVSLEDARSSTSVRPV